MIKYTTNAPFNWRPHDMWSIYANIKDNIWITVAGGYASPTAAAKDIDWIREDWIREDKPMAKGFMVGMEVWRAE